MIKVDLKKTRGDYWKAPKGAFVVIDVPRLNFLMVDGQGDPNSSSVYQAAVGALYAVSYKLKFMSKARDRDYVVPPLQGLWWADDMADFIARRKDRWRWTMMLMLPDWITAAAVAEAVETFRAKEGDIPDTLRFAAFEEGRSVQTLHVGSYDDEAPTIRRLHAAFLPEQGLIENGMHHEIYLGDPRRTAPDRLRTILRQPVRDRRADEKSNWL
ncbi:MAG: GyrI-like domain-containing protein [Devosia sp.]|uniref:GyrI-like domain-containing protein n=1 Tax=Devosia sp. 66-22 TaxID=1895753 RepID=UPI00092AEEC2|nr:GyrI-like domain-containing protein [Devosia sp. 66-22]MBN9347214.1 GyrI-like domain-containing protein [Devosia sp.]OJX50535.1 MAG: hypothetical protein BGO81_19955 [Devosia sp. 66-22]